MSSRDTKAIIHAMGMLADNLYQIGNGRSPLYSMEEFDKLALEIKDPPIPPKEILERTARG